MSGGASIRRPLPLTVSAKAAAQPFSPGMVKPARLRLDASKAFYSCASSTSGGRTVAHDGSPP